MQIKFVQDLIDILRFKNPCIKTTITKYITNYRLNQLYNYVYKQNKDNELKIEDLSKQYSEPKIYLPFPENDLRGWKRMFDPLEPCSILNNNNIRNADFLMCFGYYLTKNNIKIILKNKNKPIIFPEEAFLGGITMRLPNGQLKYENSKAMFFDDLWFHYDCNKITRIEVMLNDKNLVLSEEQKQRARNIIDTIVTNKLTKYNHQPIYTPEIGTPGKPKVLVIEQAFHDDSISQAGANDNIFSEMLDCAIKENPDADIIIKTHPEHIEGKRGGLKKAYYSKIKQDKNIYPINIGINPYSLLSIVDKVYVCSSMFGFEALLAGKEVHTFGLPCYAGWGLTIDKLKCKRRTNKRTLEELAYIIYVLYTKYYNNGKFIEPEEAINELINLRDEYFKEYDILNEDKKLNQEVTV